MGRMLVDHTCGTITVLVNDSAPKVCSGLTVNIFPREPKSEIKFGSVYKLNAKI